jgi:hypothetical protein
MAEKLVLEIERLEGVLGNMRRKLRSLGGEAFCGVDVGIGIGVDLVEGHGDCEKLEAGD